MKEDFNKKKANIEAAVYEYLVWFEICPDLIHHEESGLRKMKMDIEEDNEEAQKWIIKLATLLKHLRSIAKTWETEGSQGSNYNYSVTQPESPERAIEILRNLARGRALLTGRNHITMEDIPIVAKTVLSTGNIDKVGVFRLLISNDGRLSASQIVKALNVARPTALRNMIELTAIGLVNIHDEDSEATATSPPFARKIIMLKNEFRWLLEKEFEKLREGFEPVDNRAFMGDNENEHENDPRKEESTPYTPTEQQNIFSLKQTLTFTRMFGELENDAAYSPGMSEDKTTVSGQQLQEMLVRTGQFTQSDAAKLNSYTLN